MRLTKLDLTDEEIADHLERANWLPNANWAQISHLAGYVQPLYAKKGTLVFKEWDQDPFMTLIIKGKIAIYKSSGKDYRILARLTRGQTLGEMSLIDGEPRSASAKALEDSFLLKLNTRSINKMKFEAPLMWAELIRRIAQVLSQRLRKTSGELVDSIEPPKS